MHTDTGFTSRKDPYKTMGNHVSDAQDAGAALALAGLDYEVGKAPLFADVADVAGLQGPVYTSLENSFTLVRKDTLKAFPTKVSDRYVAFQNSDVTGFLDALADYGCTFSQGGSYADGAKAWMTMVPPEGSLNNSDGQFNGRIFAHWTHDGSGSVKFIPVVEDLFCTNQLAGILNMKQSVFIARHTTSLEGKVQQAREAMGLTVAYYAEFAADQQRLDAIDVELESILADLYQPLPRDASPRVQTNRRNALSGIHAAHTNRPERRTSGWGVVAAINEYEEWGGTVRNGSRAQRQLEAVAAQRFPLTERARKLVLA